MAPTKRARPSFSPPKPGKSKSASSKNKTRTSKSTASRKRTSESSKYAGRKGTRQAFVDDEADEESDEESDTAQRGRNHKGRSALALVDKEASDSEDKDEPIAQDEDDATVLNHGASSPEPDMILAEITTHPSSESSIPQQLVHKILQYHFEKPEKTKISVDARDLLTEYLDLFVREAVARSNEERKEREGNEHGGFLEVEDLERSAVQLSLDF